MDQKNQYLLQPLIQQITTTNSAIYHHSTTASTTSTINLKPKNNYRSITSSNASIILRLVVVIFAGLVSLWANYEASKGFAINIINETGETLLGSRFDLFYVSNDEATRLVLKTSKFVENILYPSHNDGQTHNKKQLKQVILRLSSRNLTRPTIIESCHNDEYVLHISPSILDSPNYKHDMFLALQKGMARIWLWDGQGKAPASLVNGMIEYITSLAKLKSGFVKSVSPAQSTCWKSKDPRTIAKFLNYCESRRQGFIKRLNQAMKNGWHEKMIDNALGMPAWHQCQTYNSSNKLVNSL